jgi:ABC-type transporter Mla maintaining outer membrane lipid asymmetry ATPase subunit MlaF
LRNQFGTQVVHDNLDLDVRKGEVLGVVGGSGSGKSVLLRTIIGLRRQQAGTIEIVGKETSKLSQSEAKVEIQSWEKTKQVLITFHGVTFPLEAIRLLPEQSMIRVV